MEMYKIFIKKTKYGFLAENKEFDVAVDADTIEHAASAIKTKMESEGIMRMKKGEYCPEASEITDIPEDMVVMFVETDIERKFKESSSESVRRNISMPTWMDIQLRYNSIDASKLFQDAAIEKLKEIEFRTRKKKISSIAELKESVDDKLMNEIMQANIKTLTDMNEKIWNGGNVQ